MKRLAIIFAVILVLGLSLTVGAMVAGAVPNAVITEEGIIFGTRSDSEPGEEVVDRISTDVEAIDIELDYTAEARLVSGDDYSVSYNSKYVESFVDGTQLVVKSKQQHGKYFNFGFLGSDFFSDDNNHSVIITIPKDKMPSEVSIDVSAGNIHIEDIIAESYDIDCSFGNIFMEGIKAETLNIDSNSGNSEVENSDIGVLDISNNFGTVSLDDLELASLWVMVNSGDLSTDKIALKQQAKIKMDLGSATLNFVGDEEDYKATVNIDFGSFEFNSNEIGAPTVVGHGDIPIELELSSGEAEINFVD